MMLKKNFLSFALISAVMILSLSSCVKTKSEADYQAEEQLKIDNFLSANPTLAFEHKPSGLYFLQTKAGTGPLATKNDTAYVKYTGVFLDGYVFDTNVGKPDTLAFPLRANPQWLIEGFEEGVSYLNVGAKAKLVIPSSLGYGKYGYYIIPGYTPLIYEIELVKLVQMPD